MNNIEYKQLIFDKDQIRNLYLNNEWSAYTKNEEKLFNGIKNSTDVFAAYDNQLLVGLIRTISDQETICYIQDILILKEYQRKGIGKKLINIIFDKYKHVRQIVLMTDNNNNTNEFYKRVGLIPFESIDCIGYTLKK
ncbi:GNAT family N-acetyltransferase [Candidatus Izemoplasma sp. B36]|uniref:GNAT family N-acetyltransferase n=1 Tax=Candidatus Izemoplasma sp. B36 TaxID=3242468 RepID=UPI003557A432